MSASYKEHWAELTAEESRSNERLRLAALGEARRLARVLATEYGAARVLAFGSVVEPGRFDPRSDIDLGVEGLAPERFFEALGDLMMKTRFSVDLKPIERVPQRLKSRIEQGMLLHEAR